MTILDTIAEYARERVRVAKEKVSLEEIKEQAFIVAKEGITGVKKEPFAFEKALAGEGMSFICECKKASPSKGVIAENYPYEDIAHAYEAAGADCISVLTEPKWFMGSLGHLKKISSGVGIPCIRKDFTVDEYMIYEAKAYGASAVLLICSVLPKEVVKEYIGICDSLGLSALVETHDEKEVADAIGAGARVIGVNNRNLKDFTVDTGNSKKLRELVPAGTIFVSESGVKTAEDVKELYDMGCNAVLVGETLMRAGDRKAKLAELKSLL